MSVYKSQSPGCFPGALAFIADRAISYRLPVTVSTPILKQFITLQIPSQNEML